MSLSLEPPQVVGPGPFGIRQVFVVTGGTAEGERVSGTFRAGGGDWLLAAPDGYSRLDVRGTLETHDGALIYMSYFGVI